MGRRRFPLAIVALSALSACSFEASCGGKKINAKKLEKAISGFSAERLGAAPDAVACPDDIKPENGGTFECTVTYGKMVAPVRVTQTDAEGSVSYGFVRDVIISDKVEAVLAERLKASANVDAKVRCGERFYDSKPGDTFDCIAEAPDGAKVSIGVTIKDDKANVSFADPQPIQ